MCHSWQFSLFSVKLKIAYALTSKITLFWYSCYIHGKGTYYILVIWNVTSNGGIPHKDNEKVKKYLECSMFSVLGLLHWVQNYLKDDWLLTVSNSSNFESNSLSKDHFPAFHQKYIFTKCLLFHFRRLPILVAICRNQTLFVVVPTTHLVPSACLYWYINCKLTQL